MDKNKVGRPYKEKGTKIAVYLDAETYKQVSALASKQGVTMYKFCVNAIKGLIMSKKINCAGCDDYMGEIRDATLKKEMVVLCGDCEKSRQNAIFSALLAGDRDHKGHSALKSMMGFL